MARAWETIFWISFCILFYTYAGYPLLLLLLVSLKKKLSPPPRFEPRFVLPVTHVVAAYNEGGIIEEKIKNCLSLNYPPGKMKIIFITDGSTDHSLSILKGFPSILHLHEDERHGKLAAMNRAMNFVDTDFVVFSDANTMLNRESLLLMMSHYQDDKVGGVAGEKKIALSDGAVAPGEGLYWQYESFIKRLDSQLHTVVGAAGELFSMRSAIYTQLPKQIVIEDFVQSLKICSQGYVVRYEPGAYATENASLSVKDELERKIRISAGGFQAMTMMTSLLNLLRHPVLTFQYVSHRVLRWTLAPLALVALFVSSLAVWLSTKSPFYGYSSLGQVIFYIAAVAGWLRASRNQSPGPVSVPFYFSFMNFCVFAGLWRFLTGGQPAAWKKADRLSKI